MSLHTVCWVVCCVLCVCACVCVCVCVCEHCIHTFTYAPHGCAANTYVSACASSPLLELVHFGTQSWGQSEFAWLMTT